MSRPQVRFRVVILKCTDGKAREATFPTRQAAYDFSERHAPPGLCPEQYVRRQVFDPARGEWVRSEVHR